MEGIMNTVERVKALCKERGIPIARLERECGFANGYISQLKKGTIPDNRLIIIADYFGVTVDYLLGVQTDVHHYVDNETARIAQEIFDDPDRRALFEASADCPTEYLRIASDMLRRLKETNPDG
jgi:transcriptional regulator with XRE-family HTH domain